MIELAPGAVERILTFEGYGNPAGVWFVGKEEGLGGMTPGDIDPNWISRSDFAPIMDLREAHRILQRRGRPVIDQLGLTQVWVWTARLARALDGAADWGDTLAARAYIRDRLGRTGGPTFVTNSSAVPASDDRDRAARQRDFRAAARGNFEALLARRRERLQSLIETHRPPAIVCHGNGRAARRSHLLWLGQTWPLPEDARIEHHMLANGCRVFICPFFGRWSWNCAEKLVTMLRERGRSPDGWTASNR